MAQDDHPEVVRQFEQSDGEEESNPKHGALFESSPKFLSRPQVVNSLVQQQNEEHV